MIRKKRDSLERFIRAQLIGPGGCNFQFEVANDGDQNDGTVGEVINTTPGSIYSSAILFPRQGSNDPNDPQTPEQGIPTEDDAVNTDTDDSEDASEETNDGVDTVLNIENEERRSFDHSDDIDALGRRFPNRFGISCCLSDDFNRDDLHINISGRYYRRITNPLSLRINIANEDGLNDFLTNQETIRQLGDIAILENGQLRPARMLNQNELGNIRSNLRELNRYFCTQIAQNEDETTCSVFQSLRDNGRYLSSYKERLFTELNRFDERGNYTAEANRAILIDKISIVERYETYFSYIEDIIAIFDNRGFGYWQEFNFSEELDLLNIDLRHGRIFNPNDYPALQGIVRVDLGNNIILSLDAWLQVLRRGNALYLKVLVINSSTPIASNEVRFFSIVTERVNQRAFFGVKIDISSPSIIEYHTETAYDANDEEVNRLNFLYRNIEDYGVGHLCSVDWGSIDGILHVWSEFLPSVETPDVEPIPRNKHAEVRDENGLIIPAPFIEATDFLQLKKLSVFSDATDEEIRQGLIDFVNCYNLWIDGLETDNEIGLVNIERCRCDYNRMVNNINDFLTDPDKMSCFRLMNASMFMQLWHNSPENKQFLRESRIRTDFEFYRDMADDTSIFNGIHAAWRPFQLAFILLNLDGIFRRENDNNWNERNNLVDLVWFPTGGGKTEAYLGIIALTIINRRRTFGDIGYGTASIMRYTLRLLTTQQFQRALRLIMALEEMRSWNIFNLGNEEISIGLYVGKSSLPNTDQELREEVNDWGRTHGRIPLDKCPWCGSDIDPVLRDNHQQFRCRNLRCSFGGRRKYPVRLSDEHIYEAPPTLLFGTVDKFAQLAHKVDDMHRPDSARKDSRRLFSYNGCIPPDLIIQDELHLLLGPLGSAVALYECAIDQLCTREENGMSIRPKIISSTATTRNTSLQIRALYNRAVSIFPKNGIDYDDSFFAFYKRYKTEHRGDWTFIAKRKYLGVLPTGRTQMTTQIRLAAILFVHRALFELNNCNLLNDPSFKQAADYYYTVISYFNSLKEVGKTDAQFYQEFTKYTRRLFKRVLRFSNMLECFYAYNNHYKKAELTGRLSGEEAVEELSTVQNIKWTPEQRLPFRNDDCWHRPILPNDLILATNMISVGLDVSRFNTIIMNSMPRNIAEYIQASSRVAREKEGLVITLHNPFNQRDVSHFEKFKEFHEKLYYYVEPISITPFSPKAVEMFLPLYLAALVRHRHPILSSRVNARNLNEDLSRDLKAELKRYFRVRMEQTQNLDSQEAALLTPEMLTIINDVIDRNFDIWLQEALAHQQDLVYSSYNFRNNNNLNETELFASPEDFEGDTPDDKWLVPNALRVIEPEAVIHIIR